MDVNVNRNAIITGVVSGLLVIYFFNPIISFLGNIVTTLAGHIYKSYLDKICSGLAEGEPNFSFELAGLIFGVITGIGSSSIAGYITYKRTSKNKSESRSLTSSIFSSRIILVCTIFIALVPLFLFVDGYIRIRSYSGFKQGLTIIGPYITDARQKEFLSRFSLMKNKEDYDLIMKDIIFIASDKGIKMPKYILDL